jgi:hyaluronan synthase
VVIVPNLDRFLNEIILGRKKESGEDKCLTRITQQEGWRTYYQGNAIIFSSAPLNFKTFWTQRLRWSRNSHNSDLASLWQGWAWKHPYLAFYMIDRFISIFTLFLGPIFLAISIYFNQWLIALTIVCWWLLGRGIRIIPHLRRKPKDIVLVPVYVAVNFLNAIIKLYALVTIREQKVIRQLKDKENVGSGLLKRIKDIILTAEIIGTLVMLVSLLK